MIRAGLAITFTLVPRQVEALLWASAAATGGPPVPPEMVSVLGGAEARLLLGLAQAANEETNRRAEPSPACDGCGACRSRCRCPRLSDMSAPSSATQGAPGGRSGTSAGNPAR